MIAEVEQSLEQELNPWLAAEIRFSEAANRLDLDEGLRKVLRTPAREITVAIPVQLDDGRLGDAACGWQGGAGAPPRELPERPRHAQGAGEQPAGPGELRLRVC